MGYSGLSFWATWLSSRALSAAIRILSLMLGSSRFPNQALDLSWALILKVNSGKHRKNHQTITFAKVFGEATWFREFASRHTHVLLTEQGPMLQGGECSDRNTWELPSPLPRGCGRRRRTHLRATCRHLSFGTVFSEQSTRAAWVRSSFEVEG